MKKNLQGTIPSIYRQILPVSFRFVTLFLAFFLFKSGLMAQTEGSEVQVRGKVFSAQSEPLSGATVALKNTSRATTTDAEGAFSILAPANGTLVISYTGYATQEIPILGRTDLSVTLQLQDSGMNEVIVVGYSTQRRASISGAYSTVNMANAEVRRVPDVAQVLQGQVPGMVVTSSTGAPGDDISIRVRGEGSIGSSNSPLFVVDGVPSLSISFLNPQDIATMTVLRDASAAAMYGSRAANGVILITTKSGAKGRSAIEVNYFNGFHKAGDLPKMLNAEQYMNKMEESWNNSGYSGTNPYTADKNRSDFADTDWQKELFETGRSQNVQLSVSGGSDKVQYLLSGSYFEQDGIVIFNNDNLQRLTFRSNITASVSDRLKVGTNLQLGNSRRGRLSSKGDAPGIIRHALIRPPVIPVYKDPSDPTWSEEDPFTDLPFYKHRDLNTGGWEPEYEYSSNPIALAYFTNDRINNFRTFGNAFAELGFLRNKELKLRSSLGVDLNYDHYKTFNPNFGDDDGGGDIQDQGLGRKNRPNSLNESRGQTYSITWTNTLNYSKRFGDHSISGLLGSEFINTRSNSIGGSRMRFEYTDPRFQFLNYGSSSDAWSSGSAAASALFSLFGSATYNYMDKYMLTAGLRADQSSRFGPNNRWGYFPSVSAGWRISQEDFMADVDWLSDLRLRASYGELGNQEIGDYTWQRLTYKEGDEYGVLRIGDPDLKWETTSQLNLGVDVGLLNNKLSLAVDYYIKNTRGILLPLSLPLFVGAKLEPTMINSAEVTNKGIELNINYRNNDHALKYSIGGNLGTVTNEVKKIHPNLPYLGGDQYRTVVGRPINSYYGYVMEGIYQNTKEVEDHLFGTLNPGTHEGERPGDIRFKDLDNNGIINDKDRDFIGVSIPKLSYGVTLSGSFKGFDLNILFQGVQDVDRYNDLKKITDYDSRPFNHSVRTLDAWHGEGTSNTTPRSTFQNNGSSRISSIYVEDASYLRLKNIELGYTFGNFLKRAVPQVQNVRAYISAQNLFTITNYTGLDPESTDLIDMGTYPLSKAVLFGINVSF